MKYNIVSLLGHEILILIYQPDLEVSLGSLALCRRVKGYVNLKNLSATVEHRRAPMLYLLNSMKRARRS